MRATYFLAQEIERQGDANSEVEYQQLMQKILAAQPDNLASLKEHSLVVCLWASPDVIWERVRHQTHRPLLNDPDPLGQIRALLAAREPFYRQADVLVNTEMRSVKEVAHHVLHHFHAACPRPAAP